MEDSRIPARKRQVLPVLRNQLVVGAYRWPRTGDVYRRPSNSVWLRNRNKVTLLADVRAAADECLSRNRFLARYRQLRSEPQHGESAAEPDCLRSNAGFAINDLEVASIARRPTRTVRPLRRNTATQAFRREGALPSAA
jgi:hypothetical protein